MASYERAVDRAALRARRAALRMGDEVRTARLTAGLSLSIVGSAAGISAAQVSRLERGLVRRVDLVVLARVLACVGLDLGFNAFVAGSPLRDRAHLALMSRFLARISPAWRRRVEASVAGPDDPRRWDARLDGPTSIGVEFETRLYDVQAQVRRALSKQDASGVSRLLLVVADTRHNRAVLREVRTLLADDFPLDTREVMRALAAGRDPGGNGIVVL
ncbi:MAG: helix-turn-helix domain-containing protein [Candidatus Limnocylindrales bacterium]